VQLEHLVARHRALTGGTVSEPMQGSDAEEALDALAARLDQLVSQLDPRERALLDVVLYRAMTPVQRARARGETSLLSSEERELLRELDLESDLG
jgi:hypothetical protein